MIEISDLRYKSLMQADLELSKEEINDGWHFCWEWDGLLIHPTWGEFQHCDCSGLDKIREMYKDYNYKQESLIDNDLPF